MSQEPTQNNDSYASDQHLASYSNQSTGQPGAVFYQKSPQQVEADKAAQAALICGIIGLFTVPIILGPIAIVQANKAERLGAAATAGKVLGWIDTIIGGLALLTIVGFVVLGAIAAGSSAGY
ncbi:DUF4190 domain-containing protein [Rothia nasimurium]|uniref:DUF4190 domain-containing protein n=1 Tax=Rothia nasimurium TaxID=85336 RepID=A0A4Y9F7H8_9MICC|nr:DUF4190 domain-containing protein [Rothia nasimurium]MBF0807718.1 DUF4190 domain-containing protein [Rothia nasimurium]TFU23236.1 DUF4190 domain-containing protein [Rothia nasimurium]